ncbi:signal peptidase I [Rhizobium sp. BK176]|uniref:signal peptidase I n=1 Tax=Rhizobium sp. BK176 TaxID=2587071 RepID=UPI00216A407D|nr:signal peptidase I [Rhizobium sp. BK176]MCS4089266.1 signal peptidase I [Rhizobium sp. BK176]
MSNDSAAVSYGPMRWLSVRALTGRYPASAALVGLIFGPAVVMAYLGRGWLALAYIVAGNAISLGEVLLFGYDWTTPTYLSFAVFNLIGAVHGYVTAQESDRTSYPFYGRWYGLLALFVGAPFVVIMLVKGFVYQPFTIPTNSMAPTLRSKDYVIASKFAYGYGPYSFVFDIGPKVPLFRADPQLGDIVIFRVPDGSGNDYVKRVVGLAGDRVQMKAGRLYVNGSMASRKETGKVTIENVDFIVYKERLPSGRSYSIMEISDLEGGDETAELTVPEGMVFVIGDNRDQSNDSRYTAVGYVPGDNVFARVDIAYAHEDNHWRLAE